MTELATPPTSLPVPDQQKRRVPIWLRWVVGIPITICAIVLLVLPPQRPVNLTGWTPGCPELEAEAWRAILMAEEDLGFGDPEPLEAYLPAWLPVGDELWLATLGGAGNRTVTWIARSDANGDIESTLIKDHDLARQTHLGWQHARAWTTDTLLWLPGQNMQTPAANYPEVVGLDRVTLQEKFRVAVPVTSKETGFRAPEPVRLPVTDEKRWHFVTPSLGITGSNGKRSGSGFQLLQFDPQNGDMKKLQRVVDPHHLAGQPAQFGLWTDEGGALGIGINPEMWHLDVSNPQAPALLTSRPPPPPPNTTLPSGPITVRVASGGWTLQQLSVHTYQANRVELGLAYEEFGMKRIVERVLPPPTSPSSLGAPTALDYERHRNQLVERSRLLEPFQEVDRTLEERYPSGTLRWGEAWLATSWSSQTLPLPPDLTQSLRATLDYVDWRGRWWFNEIPTLSAFVVDDDTTLLMQIVLTPQGAGRGLPDGILRIGILEPPSEEIRWLGYAKLPTGLGDYRCAMELVAYADPDRWRIGITGIRVAEGEKPYGHWWTTIRFPDGFAMPYTGWMSHNLPPELQPWREADPSATSVTAPAPNSASTPMDE